MTPIPGCITGVHHVAIITRDYPRSKRFYTQTLGFEIIAENERPSRQSTKLDLALPGGVMLEIFSFPDPPKRTTTPEAAGLRHLAFGVSDLDAAMTALGRNGVVFETVREDPYTGKRHVFFRDPDDLPLELYEA